MRKRWDTVLDGLPDFRTEVDQVAVDGDMAWIEHDWSEHEPMGLDFIYAG